VEVIPLHDTHDARHGAVAALLDRYARERDGDPRGTIHALVDFNLRRREIEFTV
jgi:hypothetical protein